MSKNRETPNRIPIHFVDDGGGHDRAATGEREDEGALTPEEIGRASIYEGETEVQRRIDRGAEEDAGRADDADTAGGPNPSELPERRDDQDTNLHAAEIEVIEATPDYDELLSDERAAAADEPQQVSPNAGPIFAELVATRAELRRIETQLKKLEEERAAEQQEMLERVARRQADFENYRKRVERERGEIHARTVGEVASQLLPIMDNLRRAVEASASSRAGESDEFRHFLQGVELIGKQLSAVLEGMGVEPVVTIGQPFDPHLHEAVALEESTDFAPDTVIEEMVRGYRLGDKLLRPAMVKVAK